MRLFAVELEHYEKLEGRALSLEGKANRLASMVRGNLGGAMQGLVVVPLFAGLDEDTGIGRIFSYDVTGGRYEEHRFHSIGSGSVFARGSLKKLYADGMSADDAILACMQALYDAADDDSATGGPDLTRQHLPGRGHGHRGRLPAAARRRVGGVRGHRGQRADARPRRPAGAAAAEPGTARLARDRPRPSRPTRARESAVSMPFYVSPEQAMKDKADYARKGIARGRSGVVLQYDGGILFAAPNPSTALHKISEIYDRIAFAAVGRYNEFENLRKAGVRYADMTGFQYDRQDVTARGLANWYAQILGSIFTDSNKPFEVEIVVAEVGSSPDDDQIYRITFDGSVAEEHGFVAMGGQSDQVAGVLKQHYADRMPLADALAAAIEGVSGPPNGERPRGQRGPARGRGTGPGPGAPQVPAAGRRPARGPADRGPAVPAPRRAAGLARATRQRRDRGQRQEQRQRDGRRRPGR